METLTHLRDVVIHVYGLRTRSQLYEDVPVFADFDEESYRRAILARSEMDDSLLAMIIAEHEQLVRLLKTVTDANWLRQGRHPVLGMMSIEFLARRVGEHAKDHAQQIEAAVGGKGSVRRWLEGVFSSSEGQRGGPAIRLSSKQTFRLVQSSLLVV